MRVKERGSRTPRRVLAIAFVVMTLMPASGSYAGQARAARTVCDPEEEALFICETNRKDKYLAICAVEAEVGKRWSAVQYRFGPEDRAELVYPEDARQGASKMFFSHVEKARSTWCRSGSGPAASPTDRIVGRLGERSGWRWRGRRHGDRCHGQAGRRTSSASSGRRCSAVSAAGVGVRSGKPAWESRLRRQPVPDPSRQSSAQTGAVNGGRVGDHRRRAHAPRP